MLAGLADNERFIYFLITFVTLNSIQNNQFPANIWVPLCCHPLFGDVNQRKVGKRINLSQTCKHELAETVFKAVIWALNKERLINSGYYDLATVYQSVHINY